jgi:hypothetical protein
MANEYTYLFGLLIFGAILGTAGLVAAQRERRARVGTQGAPGEQLALPMTRTPPPAAHAG